MPSTDWNSSLLTAGNYQHDVAVLELIFRSGEVYRYFGVPAQTYQELLQAESKGAYFNRSVRNRFPFRKWMPVRFAAMIL